MRILDGKKLSLTLQESLKKEIALLKSSPRLVVILVGNDAPSLTYVNMKTRACKNVGMEGVLLHFDENVSQERLLAEINKLNDDIKVNGILVQLPLPKHINTLVILTAVAPNKDVDGFNPINVGRIQCNMSQTQDKNASKNKDIKDSNANTNQKSFFSNLDYSNGFAPATPLGIMNLLDSYNVQIKGKNVAIIGASNIVGKPLACLMLNAGATISLCHILTQDISFYTKNADIVCVGVGKVNLIKADMIKKGAVVVDIGINRLDNGRLVGDVDFEEVSKRASFITPVPGGVGPMTVTALLFNTLKAYRLANNI